MLPVQPTVKSKLDSFFQTKKIPHLIFHGSSGTGKRTIVQQFLHQIYNNDKAKMKSNIMFVNCAHGKGIKFIREELKFFAKSNIQFNQGVPFKTIVLLNADNLTIDAQSALRRCIELFSNNTRFFIIVENKHKLLNPILSRFCEIYVPEYIDPETNEVINLHQLHLKNTFDFANHRLARQRIVYDQISTLCDPPNHSILVQIVEKMYELGISCIDLIEWIRTPHSPAAGDGVSAQKKNEIIMEYHKIKSEYRCEKMLMLYILNKYYMVT